MKSLHNSCLRPKTRKRNFKRSVKDGGVNSAAGGGGTCCFGDIVKDGGVNPTVGWGGTHAAFGGGVVRGFGKQRLDTGGKNKPTNMNLRRKEKRRQVTWWV